MYSFTSSFASGNFWKIIGSANLSTFLLEQGWGNLLPFVMNCLLLQSSTCLPLVVCWMPMEFRLLQAEIQTSHHVLHFLLGSTFLRFSSVSSYAWQRRAQCCQIAEKSCTEHKLSGLWLFIITLQESFLILAVLSTLIHHCRQSSTHKSSSSFGQNSLKASGESQ